MLRKIEEKVWDFDNANTSACSINQTVQSYLGYLSHANSYKLKDQIVSKLTLDDFSSWFYTL